MYLSSLQPLSTPHAYICGDVDIDSSAVVAPGVLLQADPGSRIVVGPGVCIGMGTIVHACEGVLTIESGANIGAGVLLVGAIHIGRNACIGATTTIYNTIIPPCEMIAPGSLLCPASATPTPSPVATPPQTEMPHIETEFTQVQAQTQEQGTSYGQMQLNRLMVKIFPNRQSPT